MRRQDAADIREGIRIAKRYGIHSLKQVRDQENILTLRAYLHTLAKNETKRGKP